MKKILFILIASLLGAAVKKEPASLIRWVVQENSSLQIQGSSNVNEFRCDIDEYLTPDTLRVDNSFDNQRLLFTNSVLILDINRFDCHQRYITSDLRKTLKADENPFLKIQFLTIDNFMETGSPALVNGQMSISLAGVVKKIDIRFSTKKINTRQLRLTGEKELRFSDFDLKPPRKLAGLIRINENIKIRFQLELRSI